MVSQKEDDAIPEVMVGGERFTMDTIHRINNPESRSDARIQLSRKFLEQDKKYYEEKWKEMPMKVLDINGINVPDKIVQGNTKSDGTLLLENCTLVPNMQKIAMKMLGLNLNGASEVARVELEFKQRLQKDSFKEQRREMKRPESAPSGGINTTNTRSDGTTPNFIRRNMKKVDQWKLEVREKRLAELNYKALNAEINKDELKVHALDKIWNSGVSWLQKSQERLQEGKNFRKIMNPLTGEVDPFKAATLRELSPVRSRLLESMKHKILRAPKKKSYYNPFVGRPTSAPTTGTSTSTSGYLPGGMGNNSTRHDTGLQRYDQKIGGRSKNRNNSKSSKIRGISEDAMKSSKTTMMLDEKYRCKRWLSMFILQTFISVSQRHLLMHSPNYRQRFNSQKWMLPIRVWKWVRNCKKRVAGSKKMKLLFLVARVRYRLYVLRLRRKKSAYMIMNLLQRTTQAVPIKRACQRFLNCVSIIQAGWRRHRNLFSEPLKVLIGQFDSFEKSYLAECQMQTFVRRAMHLTPYMENILGRQDPLTLDPNSDKRLQDQSLFIQQYRIPDKLKILFLLSKRFIVTNELVERLYLQMLRREEMKISLTSGLGYISEFVSFWKPVYDLDFLDVYSLEEITSSEDLTKSMNIGLYLSEILRIEEVPKGTTVLEEGANNEGTNIEGDGGPQESMIGDGGKQEIIPPAMKGKKEITGRKGKGKKGIAEDEPDGKTEGTQSIHKKRNLGTKQEEEIETGVERRIIRDPSIPQIVKEMVAGLHSVMGLVMDTRSKFYKDLYQNYGQYEKWKSEQKKLAAMQSAPKKKEEILKEEIKLGTSLPAIISSNNGGTNHNNGSTTRKTHTTGTNNNYSGGSKNYCGGSKNYSGGNDNSNEKKKDDGPLIGRIGFQYDSALEFRKRMNNEPEPHTLRGRLQRRKLFFLRENKEEEGAAMKKKKPGSSPGSSTSTKGLKGNSTSHDAPPDQEALGDSNKAPGTASSKTSQKASSTGRQNTMERAILAAKRKQKEEDSVEEEIITDSDFDSDVDIPMSPENLVNDPSCDLRTSIDQFSSTICYNGTESPGLLSPSMRKSGSKKNLGTSTGSKTLVTRADRRGSNAAPSRKSSIISGKQ